MLLTFWQAPVPAGNSSTVSHVDMPSLWYRYTMIQLVASASLHASLYPTTSHSKPLRLATPSTPVEAEGLEPQGDNDCRESPFKKARGRPQTTRLTAGWQRAWQAAWNGTLQMSLTEYNTALSVVERATMCSAVQQFSGWPVDQCCCTRFPPA